MRAEQDIRLRDKTLQAHTVIIIFLVGMNHIKLRDIATLHGGKPRICGNLPQGGSKCQRIAAKLGTARIGDVLALARDGKARERAEEIPDGGPYQQDNQYQDNSCTNTIVLATMAARHTPHVRQNAGYYMHHHREYAHENNAHHHQARVAVLDVREFMTHDRRKFCIVQFVYNSCCECNGIRLDIDTARKGIKARILDNVDLRHLDATRNAEVLHDVVDTHVLLAFERARVGRMPDNGYVREVRNDEPDSRHRQRKRHRIEEIAPDDSPVERSHLQARRANAIPAKKAEPVQQHDSPEHHSQEEQWEHEKQNNRIAVIPPNLGLDTDVFHL